VLDVERLDALEPEERAFAIGSGLGHVQCGHGAYFATQWLLCARHDDRAWLKIARRLLVPWREVMTFSADRAGLAACLELPTAFCALAELEAANATVNWLGQQPPLAVREQALADFAQSPAMRRFAALARKESEESGRGRDTWIRSHGEASSHVDRAEGSDLDRPVEKTETAASLSSSILEDEDAADESIWSLARCDARLTARLGLY
jgi:hypothetical protein